MTNQLQRILVAVIGIPLGLGLVWYGGLPLAVLVAVVGGLGTREFYDLVGRSGTDVRPLRGLGLTVAALAAFLTWLWTAPVEERIGPVAQFVAAVLAPLWIPISLPLAGLLLVLVVLTAVLFRRAPGERPAEAAGTTLLGAVYAGVLPCALLLIRFDAGTERSWPAAWLVFFPLAITWICDSFAMWGGQLFGRHKLWPSVSPGKTREGAIAGVIGGVLAAIAYALLVLAPVGYSVPAVQAAVIGLVISVVAQVGDLAESLFKRQAGVKDSSGLIPGHGGVLDRFDSLYFVLPVAALLYRVFGVGE
ncbi:MAG: phosphatidate cytidylyltransferase [Gemmatimonadales bacterium]